MREWCMSSPFSRTYSGRALTTVAIIIAINTLLYVVRTGTRTSLILLGVVFGVPAALALGWIIIRERRRSGLAASLQRVEQGLCKRCAYDMSLPRPIGLGPARCSECGVAWPMLLSRNEPTSAS